MGDPTLRLKITAPVSSLTGISNSGNVVLTWNPSSETAAQYFVYRSTNGMSGVFTNLTASWTTALSFTDASPPAGQKVYQVRTAKGVTTASGSYTNLSQGLFTTIN